MPIFLDKHPLLVGVSLPSATLLALDSRLTNSSPIQGHAKHSLAICSTRREDGNIDKKIVNATRLLPHNTIHTLGPTRSTPRVLSWLRGTHSQEAMLSQRSACMPFVCVRHKRGTHDCIVPMIKPRPDRHRSAGA
jgi:hypothetical protein